MKRTTLLAVAALALFACSKKPESPPGPAGQKPGEGAAGAPLPPPPKYVETTARNAPEQNVAGEVHPFLTQQLRIFVREKGRLPESFAELARARLDSVPRPPAGKKWVIDAASREVKAVSAQ
jgi:type IV secretory pathway VirB10-like protein